MMNDMFVDYTRLRANQVKVVGSLPSISKPIIYFPPASTRAELIIEVESTESTKYFALSANPIDSKQFFCVVALDDNLLFACIKGIGHFIDIDKNVINLFTEIVPVVDLMFSLTQELVIVIGDTEIGCLDKLGIRWTSGRISLDGICDVRIEEGQIGASVRNPLNSDWHHVSLDLRTGKPTTPATR